MSDPRELLDAYGRDDTWSGDLGREDIAPRAFAALRAVLDLHPAGYPSREPEYGSHAERTESGQWVSVRNAEPDRPYFCETCQESWPCPTVQAVTEVLEAAGEA